MLGAAHGERNSFLYKENIHLSTLISLKCFLSCASKASGCGACKCVCASGGWGMGMAVCLLQFYFINILVSGAELGESHWNHKQHWLWCLWQCHGAFALFIPGCTTHTAFREYFQTESLISTYVESSQSSWELSSLLFNFFYLLNVCQRWKLRMMVWRNFAY